VDQSDRITWNVTEWQAQLVIAYESSGCKISSLYKRLQEGTVKPGDKNYELTPYRLLRRKIHLPVGPTKALTLQSQLVIPKSMRHEMLALFHSNVMSGHFGRNKMYSKMLPVIWWPGIYKDIRKFVAQCVPCQRHKGAVHKNRPLFTTMPCHTWETACIDLVGPLPISDRGNIFVSLPTLSQNGRKQLPCLTNQNNRFRKPY
jgi:hypothetical protein